MTYRYDLQVHTDASPCSNASPEKIVETAVRTNLDGIAITDHDTMKNVERVCELAPPTLDVIGGVEVTTTEGHLLALGVDETPLRSDPLSVIEAIHNLGGLAVLSHPFDTLREHFDTDIDTIAYEVDGIEVVNSRCVRASYNRKARAFAERHNISPTGGSDAHFPMEIGRAYTETDRQIEEALRKGTTNACGRGRYLSGHAATKIQQFRSKFYL